MASLVSGHSAPSGAMNRAVANPTPGISTGGGADGRPAMTGIYRGLPIRARASCLRCRAAGAGAVVSRVRGYKLFAVDGPSRPGAAAWMACRCESVSTRSGCRAPWYASVRPRCSSPPSSYFSPYRMEYSEFEAPRARGPTTTPAEPLDSTLTPPRVPDMWPTPALVTPTVKPDRWLRRNPTGPFAAPVKENVVKSLRLGGLPLMTFVRALMNPEQSKPPGPTPPHTYGLPACARAYRSARCTGGPPTPESMLL